MSDIEKLRDLCNSALEFSKDEDMRRVDDVLKWAMPASEYQFSFRLGDFVVLKPKKDFMPRLHYDDFLDPSKILKPKKDL